MIAGTAGVPPANALKMLRLSRIVSEFIFALRAHCGRDAPRSQQSLECYPDQNGESPVGASGVSLA